MWYNHLKNKEKKNIFIKRYKYLQTLASWLFFDIFQNERKKNNFKDEIKYLTIFMPKTTSKEENYIAFDFLLIDTNNEIFVDFPSKNPSILLTPFYNNKKDYPYYLVKDKNNTKTKLILMLWFELIPSTQYKTIDNVIQFIWCKKQFSYWEENYMTNTYEIWEKNQCWELFNTNKIQEKTNLFQCVHFLQSTNLRNINGQNNLKNIKVKPFVALLEWKTDKDWLISYHTLDKQHFDLVNSENEITEESNLFELLKTISSLKYDYINYHVNGVDKITIWVRSSFFENKHKNYHIFVWWLWEKKETLQKVYLSNDFIRVKQIKEKEKAYDIILEWNYGNHGLCTFDKTLKKYSHFQGVNYYGDIYKYSSIKVPGLIKTWDNKAFNSKTLSYNLDFFSIYNSKVVDIKYAQYFLLDSKDALWHPQSINFYQPLLSICKKQNSYFKIVFNNFWKIMIQPTNDELFQTHWINFENYDMTFSKNLPVSQVFTFRKWNVEKLFQNYDFDQWYNISQYITWYLYSSIMYWAIWIWLSLYNIKKEKPYLIIHNMKNKKWLYTSSFFKEK